VVSPVADVRPRSTRWVWLLAKLYTESVRQCTWRTWRSVSLSRQLDSRVRTPPDATEFCCGKSAPLCGQLGFVHGTDSARSKSRGATTSCVRMTTS